MSSAAMPRRIWLCADDYGMSPGVNRAIRELIKLRRINATSVMMVGPAIDRAEADALKAAVSDNPGCAIGLHATMTAPFRPSTMHFRPTDGSAFLRLGTMLRKSLLRQLDRDMMQTEFEAQFAAFAKMFGAPPAYADGHQHVQTFPQVRDAFLDAATRAAPEAWVRQCGSVHRWTANVTNLKAMLLGGLSAGFRRAASHRGIAFNPAFAGAYDFTRPPEFRNLMADFLEGLPDGGLIMCHPGFVDDTLRDLDPLTDQREREYEYLAGDQFPQLLASSGAVLIDASVDLSHRVHRIAQI